MADRGWVMLVEDDRAVAEMYRAGLEAHGFRVSVAGSGEELFATLNGAGPQVFVLDYQLPGANGADVLAMIREDERTSDALVFMLSNFPNTYDGAIDRVAELGAVAWLEKARTSPVLLAERLGEALAVRSRDGSSQNGGWYS